MEDQMQGICASVMLEHAVLANKDMITMVTSLMTSDDTNRRVSRELQSVKPYKTKDEYLYAMKEDLSEWFNSLYDLDITADNFFEQLDTGVVLCRHALMTRNYIMNLMTSSGENSSELNAMNINNNHQVHPEQASMVTYTTNVKPGTFHCRDNISNFISWCRHSLHIPETLLFETDDLVLRKNERNVILCILETARRGVKFGMPAPLLVQLEQEIEEEIIADKISADQTDKDRTHEDRTDKERTDEDRTDEDRREAHDEGSLKKNKASDIKGKPVIQVDMMSLDEMVREILSRCTCPNQFPMIRISEGRYRIGDSLTQIFIRILRKHVMVRIGGGWDTLENYLDRHDPCQCQNKDNAHEDYKTKFILGKYLRAKNFSETKIMKILVGLKDFRDENHGFEVCTNQRGHRGSSAQRRPSRSRLTTTSVLSTLSWQSERSSFSEPENTSTPTNISTINQTTESGCETKQSPLNTSVSERQRSNSRTSYTKTRTPSGAQLNASEIRSKLRRSSTLPASTVRPLAPMQLAVSTMCNDELNRTIESHSNDSEAVLSHYSQNSPAGSRIIIHSPSSTNTPASSSNESLIEDAVARRGFINLSNSSRQGSEHAANLSKRSLSNSRSSLQCELSNSARLSQTSLGQASSNSNSQKTDDRKPNVRNIRRTSSTSDVNDSCPPVDLQKDHAKMKSNERKQMSDQQRQFNLSLLTRKSPRGRENEQTKTKERARSVGPLGHENTTVFTSKTAGVSKQNQKSICDSDILFVSRDNQGKHQLQPQTVFGKTPSPRARSVGPQEMEKRISSRSINLGISQSNRKFVSDDDVLMVSRDGTGRHQLDHRSIIQTTPRRQFKRKSLPQLPDQPQQQQERQCDVSPLDSRLAQKENRYIQTEQIHHGSTVQRSRSAVSSDNALKSRISRSGLPTDQLLPNKRRSIIYSSSSDNSLDGDENYEHTADKAIPFVDNLFNSRKANDDEIRSARTDLLFEEYRRVGQELMGLINNANDCDDLFKCRQDISLNSFINSYNEVDNFRKAALSSNFETFIPTDQTLPKPRSNPCMVVNPMEPVYKEPSTVVDDSISAINCNSATSGLDTDEAVNENGYYGLQRPLGGACTFSVGSATNDSDSTNAGECTTSAINRSICDSEDVTMQVPDGLPPLNSNVDDVLQKSELLWFSSQRQDIDETPHFHNSLEKVKSRKDEKYNSASKIPKPIHMMKTRTNGIDMFIN